jgi:FtsH-binding integral membrane protein
VAGFLLGTSTQGVAMGFLLLAAALVSRMSLGNPFVFIGLAAGLTFFSALGMAAYCWMAPRNFSMIGAALGALTIPMLIAMAVGFAFPSLLGGTAGLVVSGLFVLVSAGSLLYQLNVVMHRFTVSMHIEGAYTLTIGILTLFWNILSLLMRANRR